MTPHKIQTNAGRRSSAKQPPPLRQALPRGKHTLCRFGLALGLIVACVTVSAGQPADADARPAEGPNDLAPGGFRGLFFNPRINNTDDYPWLLHYRKHRDEVKVVLREVVEGPKVNFLATFILIPHTLRSPAQGNVAGQDLAEWANIGFLDNVAAFVDDCHAAGLSVELDLADNRWVPYSVDSANHRIGAPGDPWWPVADDTPWDESAEWHRQIITYVEARAAHPEAIAMWSMTGNYMLGGAEPVLWDTDHNPAIQAATETFVKHVWPVFMAAGKRPKMSPILLPIFRDDDYWSAHEEQRLSAFRNARKWIVDDLAMPPDYWGITSYPHCDPAPNGRHYFRKIIEILGPGSASRIISTDFKATECDLEQTILAVKDADASALLDWHFTACAEYGFAGWWIWAYQDTSTHAWGLRSTGGRWRETLVERVAARAAGAGNLQAMKGHMQPSGRGTGVFTGSADMARADCLREECEGRGGLPFPSWAPRSLRGPAHRSSGRRTAAASWSLVQAAVSWYRPAPRGCSR